MKKNLEIRAKELRRKGYSLNELKDILNVSKSTISRWINGINLSAVAKERINNNYTKGQLASQKTKKEQTIQKNIIADIYADDILKNFVLDFNTVSIFCAMIYQCEGSKNIKDSVTFTNSDPDLIRTFINLFRESFDLDESKFRILMHLHNYHNEALQKKFWSDITKVPVNQFLKTFNKPNTGIYKKEGYQGCIQVRYRDVKIGRQINAVAKKLMERYK